MNLNGENAGISKYARSFGLSLALASVVNSLLVVAKEKSPAIQSAMQRLTGHHWVTHVVIVLTVYAGGGWLFARPNGGQGVRLTANRLIVTLMSGVMAGALIIVGFYLLGD
jgi:hypothetical protein